MIPKRIFYVWGVNDKKKRDVLACMQSWRQICQDYEIIEINEDSKEYFNFQYELENNCWFRTVYERKMWAYVADYVRCKVLYDCGGIYLDTDVTVVKNFDKFLNDNAFVGMQDNAQDGIVDFVEPAILGAQKGNIFLQNILKFYDENIWHENIYTMPQLFDWGLHKLYSDIKPFGKREEQQVIHYQDITIYPEGVFIPFRYAETFTPECIKENTHTIHWWNASWVKPDVLFFLENKHKYTPQELEQQQYHAFKSVCLFNLLPIAKYYTNTHEVCICGVPVFTKISDKNKNIVTDIRLFKHIPFWKVRQKTGSKKYYLFGIPVLKTICKIN